MLNTIILEAVKIGAIDGDKHSAAVASVVCFVLIVVVLFFGILAGLQFIPVCLDINKEGGCTKNIIFKTMLLFIQVLGALLYFYGDNINSILKPYAQELGCSPRCVENNRIASVLCLGGTLIIYHLLPPCMHRVHKFFNLDEDSDHWYTASSIITTIIKIDALFTVVAIMAQTQEFCSAADMGISTGFFILCLLVGVCLMVAYCLFSWDIIYDKKKDYCWIVPVAFGFLVVCFPLYVLADNQQPLDCWFKCDTFASNKTFNDLGCDTRSNSATRITFTLFTFIVIAAISILLLVCKENTNTGDEEVDVPKELEEDQYLEMDDKAKMA